MAMKTPKLQPALKTPSATAPSDWCLSGRRILTATDWVTVTNPTGSRRCAAGGADESL